MRIYDNTEDKGEREYNGRCVNVTHQFYANKVNVGVEGRFANVYTLLADALCISLLAQCEVGFTPIGVQIAQGKGRPNDNHGDFDVNCKN